MINLHLHTLSVDDEPDIREIIDLALGLDPLFVVRECPSGREALRDAVEWRPDLILLDVMMPIMDGVTTLTELRADRRTAMIPVVFMTARAQTHECERFKSLGAAGVIAKPFDPMRLPTLVRDCVSAGEMPADDYLWRLDDAHMALSAFRAELAQPHGRAMLAGLKDVAQTLVGASRLYGFAGIGLEAAALEEAVDGDIAGRAAPMQVEHAIDRVLARIATN
ncbi:MAG TPA: response regulator [Xanthobacteraceae bacterium]|nr:response regulator [Xanthobacteraceae bacterium]